MYVIDSVRTPIGKYGGTLSSVRPDDLLAHVIKQLLSRNKKWASSKVNEDADYFTKMKAVQNPDFLWIGCSDSRTDPQMVFNVAPASFSSSATWPTLCRPMGPITSRTA